MNNKIDGNMPPMLRPGAGSPNQVAGDGQELAGSMPAKRSDGDRAGADSLSVTSTAALLAELAASIDELPEASDTRIDVASDAIRNGTYQVNASTIADALLRSEREA